MINIIYPVKKIIPIAWSGITLPLKAGTPVSAAGAVANTGYAIGLIAQDHTTIDGATAEIYVGGVVATAEVNASAGITLEKSAKQAMDGINFLDANGNPESKTDPYVLPAAAVDSLGGVIMAANVAASDATTIAGLKDTVNDLLDALKEVGIMDADPEPEADPEADPEPEEE